MPCYLCAYQLDDEPEVLEERPDGSPPSAQNALGTCYICSVWACDLHGTRYGQFECAMCTPAVATRTALSPEDQPTDVAAGAAATAVAYEVGVRAGDHVKVAVEKALRRIAEHQRPDVGPFEDLSVAKPRSGEPDLLFNFAEVIRASSGEQGDFLPGVRWEAGRESIAPQGPRVPAQDVSVSIDAVGAAVRAAFAGRAVEVTTDAVDIVAGALLLSMAVANRPRARRHGPEGVDAALAADVARPWEVTHPVLLDPVMWLIATAYYEEQR